eukprot:TRINITY_DN684_c1_g2_i2.p1 TRINITY_DN684_c1_g2~~TRINITY_DN684_c1_g2_i2.p1  ORF type:complete len:352 (-),score=65.40 TRINITY_DN684_c1_g2_i2:267-1322(-)
MIYDRNYHGILHLQIISNFGVNFTLLLIFESSLSLESQQEKNVDDVGYESLLSATESLSRLSSITSSSSEDTETDMCFDYGDGLPESAETSSFRSIIKAKIKLGPQSNVMNESTPRRNSTTEKGCNRLILPQKSFTPILSAISAQSSVDEISQPLFEVDVGLCAKSNDVGEAAIHDFLPSNVATNSIEALKGAAGSSHSPSLTSTSLRQVRSITPQNSIFLSRPSANHTKPKPGPLVLATTSSFGSVPRPQSASKVFGFALGTTNIPVTHSNHIQHVPRGSDLESQAKVVVKAVPTGKIDSTIQSLYEEIFQDSVTTMAYGLVVSGLTLWIFAVLIFMNKIPGFDFDESSI